MIPPAEMSDGHLHRWQAVGWTQTTFDEAEHVVVIQSCECGDARRSDACQVIWADVEAAKADA